MNATDNDHIVWLDEPACQNLLLAGGKAANLSRLAATYPVPPGFCLTTAAFEAAATAGFAVAEKRTASKSFPPALHDKLVEAYRVLADRCGLAEPSLAVRSSAVDEDGLTASFAGQHETFLNVIGVEAVTGAVQRCWASAQSSRALAYRRQHGQKLDEAWLAVLVQQLIIADVSAVVFSANPITGNQDELVINASWGLGESIVGGTVTPDTYLVSKTALTIISRRISKKRQMMVTVEGGTQEVAVPRFLQARPALTDSQVVEMAKLALALEAEMGWPVDVECAYQGDKLYLLQCRPITTLESKEDRTGG